MIDVPEGYRELEPTENVMPGDLWCHRGDFMTGWIPSHHFGHPGYHYNRYCTKAEPVLNNESESVTEEKIDDGIPLDPYAPRLDGLFDTVLAKADALIGKLKQITRTLTDEKPPQN